VRFVERFDHESGRVVTNECFHAGADGRAVPNPNAPIPVRLLDDLVRYGYDPSLHDRGGFA
jgi:hypothetical protein